MIWAMLAGFGLRLSLGIPPAIGAGSDSPLTGGGATPTYYIYGF